MMILIAKMAEHALLKRLKTYEHHLANVLIIPKVRNVKISFVESVFRAIIMAHVMVKHVNAFKRMEKQSIMVKIVNLRVKKHVN